LPYDFLKQQLGATIFKKAADYAAFEKILHQARDCQDMRLLAYCLICA
jgi:hypothetical protein